MESMSIDQKTIAALEREIVRLSETMHTASVSLPDRTASLHTMCRALALLVETNARVAAMGRQPPPSLAK